MSASAAGGSRQIGSETVATWLGWGEGVGENAPGCGGVLLAQEKEVAAMVLWPPRGVGGMTRCNTPCL
jgi:hypothetical protein